MELVGPGLCSDGHDALAVTVVRGEVVVDHPDFLDSLFVGDDRCFVEAVAHDGESIQLNVVFKGPAAVDADGGKLRPAGDADSK